MLNLLLGTLLVGDAVKGIVGTIGIATGLMASLEERMGFVPGQGLLTPSVKFKVSPDSKHQLGRDIASVAGLYNVLQRYVGKTYMMTVVEETQVKAMVRVITSLAGASALRFREQMPELGMEADQIGEQAAESLAVFFWQFPEGRTT